MPSVWMPSAASTGLHNKGYKDPEGGQARGWWSQRLSDIIHAGPPRGHRMVAAVPGITSRHHHVQGKKEDHFQQ